MSEIIRVGSEFPTPLPIFEEPSSLKEAALFINQLGKNMGEHAYIVGKILIWVKSQLKHGEFLNWIEDNVWFKERTARNFITFANKCDEQGFLLNEPHYLEKMKSAKFADIKPLKLPLGKYFILYADPPWQYQNIGFDESAEQQYPTMSVEEICELPVHNLITDKAVLFLWVTNAFINEGLQVCEAWGFKYKTNFAWIKNSGPSIGWFIKSRHELLFIATKGEGVHPGEKFISWFEFKVRKHSQKPELVYEMIEKMYSGPYMELFARENREGWDNWGNELK